MALTLPPASSETLALTFLTCPIPTRVLPVPEVKESCLSCISGHCLPRYPHPLPPPCISKSLHPCLLLQLLPKYAPFTATLGGCPHQLQTHPSSCISSHPAPHPGPPSVPAADRRMLPSGPANSPFCSLSSQGLIPPFPPPFSDQSLSGSFLGPIPCPTLSP